MGKYRVEIFLIYIGQIEHCDQAWRNTFLKTRTNFNFKFPTYFEFCDLWTCSMGSGVISLAHACHNSDIPCTWRFKVCQINVLNMILRFNDSQFFYHLFFCASQAANLLNLSFRWSTLNLSFRWMGFRWWPLRLWPLWWLGIDKALCSSLVPHAWIPWF